MTPQRWFGTLAVAFTLIGGRALFAQDPRVLPANIGDLNTAQLVEVLDQKGEVLLHGTFKTSSTTPKEIERKADLISPTGQKSKGKVEIEIETKDSGVKNEVEVKLEMMPVNMQCELRLDGKAAATFLTSKNGRAKFELERTETSPSSQPLDRSIER